MMANLLCPLDPFVIRLWKNEMKLSRVEAIENHVQARICIHPPLKDLVLHGDIDGSTPLLLACKGYLDSVKRIVEHWGVDVRAPANYYHSHSYYSTKAEKVGGATPLFVAIRNGHVDIVSYLISKGADVSAMPGGISPLLVAPQLHGLGDVVSVNQQGVIFRLLLEGGAGPSILTPSGAPIWTFCGAYATIALIEHGINLDLRDSTGRTVLHHWIDLASSPLYIIGGKKLFTDGTNLLLGRGVDLNARPNKGFTPILYSAHQLKNPSEQIFDPSIQLGIFELLSERGKTDLIEKIDALELAGANLILEHMDLDDAFHCWRNALRLRETGKEEKIPLQTSGLAVEWETLEQLETIISDPSLHWISAMSTCLRIYAKRGCFDYRLMQDYACIFGNTLMDNHGDYVKPTMSQLLDLALVFLDRPETDLSKYKKELAHDFAIYLPSTLENDHPLTDVDFETIKSFLKLMLAVDPEWRPRYGCDFFKMLASLPDVLLREDVRKYFSYSARQDNGTLLASACVSKEWETLRLLLHLRSDPNTNGPLLTVNDQVMLGNDELLSGAKCKLIKTSLQFMSAADPEGHSTHSLFHYDFFKMLADIPDVLLPVNVRTYLSKYVREKEGLLLANAYLKKDTKTLRLFLHLRADPNAAFHVSYGNRLLHIVANQHVQYLAIKPLLPPGGEVEPHKNFMESIWWKWKTAKILLLGTVLEKEEKVLAYNFPEAGNVDEE